MGWNHESARKGLTKKPGRPTNQATVACFSFQTATTQLGLISVHAKRTTLLLAATTCAQPSSSLVFLSGRDQEHAVVTGSSIMAMEKVRDPLFFLVSSVYNLFFSDQVPLVDIYQ